MKIEEFKKYEGKKVFLVLKSGLKYSGTLVRVNEASSTISLKDKYDLDVSLSIEEITLIANLRNW